jgi:G:T-mismatch repair DNA endonuclease (very short patch repair protein)
MSDRLTIEQRHNNMAAIRGRDTKPEIPIRRCRGTLGYRKGCLQQDCDQWYLVYRNRSCIDCISFIALCGI